jgi:TorA maturation chaperone TorD
LVSPAGVRIDPERTRAIREFRTPRDNRGISRFIGMVNFYHKFIPWLADVAVLLNALHKKGVKFVWRKEQQEASEALKQAILQPPVLRMADFSKKFILQTVKVVSLWGRCFHRRVTVLNSLLHMPRGR